VWGRPTVFFQRERQINQPNKEEKNGKGIHFQEKRKYVAETSELDIFLSGPVIWARDSKLKFLCFCFVYVFLFCWGAHPQRTRHKYVPWCVSLSLWVVRYDLFLFFASVFSCIRPVRNF